MVENNNIASIENEEVSNWIPLVMGLVSSKQEGEQAEQQALANAESERNQLFASMLNNDNTKDNTGRNILIISMSIMVLLIIGGILYFTVIKK